MQQHRFDGLDGVGSLGLGITVDGAQFERLHGRLTALLGHRADNEVGMGK
jgi:hypothetical protein